MKRFILIAVSTMTFFLATAQDKESYLFIGSYTSDGNTEGIHVYKFNSETGEPTRISATRISNANFLAISQDQKYVYAINEDSTDAGSIAAFSFDKKKGTLQFINKKSSGNHPCYVSVTNNNKWVVAGHYGGGTVGVLPVKADGSLDEIVSNVQHQGSGVNKERQEKSHVHCTVLSPDNQWVYVPDLGIDKVMIYALDDKTGKLTSAPQPFAQAEPGDGPRHFTFHPNNKYAYLIEELSGHVIAYKYDKGKLEQIQRISTIEAGKTGYAGSADIHVSPDGKFLYASNRGDFDNIAIYKVDTATGKLTTIGFQSTLGKMPRNFNIDPSGNFLLVANQNTDDVVIFKRNKNTGLLTDTGKRIKEKRPVCLKWAAVK